MVSSVQTSPHPHTCNRLVSILKETGLPGDDSDHQWIAQRLQYHAEELSHVHESDYLADLFVSGILRERGIDPTKSSSLAERHFPEAYLQSAVKLLKIALPQSTWRLVESGILSYQGTVWGNTDRWVIHADLLKNVTDSWHELGETLMIRNLAKGLIPLAHDSSSPLQFLLTGVTREKGRAWMRYLSAHFSSSEKEPGPHFLLG